MEKKEKLLRIILTAATVLLLLLLAWQCLDIYRVGNSSANLDANGLYIQPVYRSDDVMARLRGLGIWAAGYLALVIGAWALLMPGAAKTAPLARGTAHGKGVAGNKPREAGQKSSRLFAVRICLYCVAALLILLGIRNGGMRDVLVKAINICTECIGLG